MNVSGSITRTELALADLAFEVDGEYRIIGSSLGPGQMTWRREIARSPFVHGEMLVGAVKEQEIAPIGVRVLGTTMSQLWSRVGALLAAFEQFEYSVTIVLDGVSFTWTCQPADYGVGDAGVFQDHHLRSLQQEVRFSVPRHPVPVAGVV